MSINAVVYIDDRQSLPKCHCAVWNDWVQQSDLPQENFIFSSVLSLKIPKKWNISTFVAMKLLFRWWALTQGFKEKRTIVCVDATGWARNALTLNLVKELGLARNVMRSECGDWSYEPMLIIPSLAWNTKLGNAILQDHDITQFDSFTEAYDFIEKKMNELLCGQISVVDKNLFDYVSMSSYQSRPWYYYSAKLRSEWVQRIQELVSRGLYSRSILSEEIFNGSVRPSLQYCLLEATSPERCFPLLDVDQNFTPSELLLSTQEISRLNSYRLWWRIISLRLENNLRIKGRKKILFLGPFKFFKKLFRRIAIYAWTVIHSVKKVLNPKD